MATLTTWTSPKGVKWIATPRRSLPRFSANSDFGIDRPLLLEANKAGQVWWWRSHTTWICQGHSSTFEARLEVSHMASWGSMTNTTVGDKGGRMSYARLNAPEARKRIASLFDTAESELPPLDPKVTWDRVNKPCKCTDKTTLYHVLGCKENGR